MNIIYVSLNVVKLFNVKCTKIKVKQTIHNSVTQD